MVREIITISNGQAGVQLANATWELLSIEHGIECDGTANYNMSEMEQGHCETFYSITPEEKFVPRAIFVDLEPTVVDEVRTGPYRQLFHPDQLISEKEDAANNYARGHFSLGKSIIMRAMEQIIKLSENCDALQGFLCMQGIGGGTGSGFCSLLLENLKVIFSKKNNLCLNIFPGPQLSTAIVEPYNAILQMHSSMEHTELCIGIDNEAIYKICESTLSNKVPTYTDLNRLSAYVFSSITASLRYETLVSADIDQLQTNLVPYPRIHFPLVSYSPFMSTNRGDHLELSVNELTQSLFSKESQMIVCDCKAGKYMSCCIMYRGDVNPQDVCKAITKIKNSEEIQFVDWCPTGFKTGIQTYGPCVVTNSQLSIPSRSACMLTNNTAIVQSWKKLDQKFDCLFSKRAFVHHYVGEGMEEGEFNEAREDMSGLVKNYEEIVLTSTENDQSEEEG